MKPLFIPTTRLHAAVLHLAISVLVALLVLCLVFGIWYPSPWASALGVTKIFLIILTVDLSIGPLLTLLVFKVGKPSLKFDLTMIAVIQLSALLYGVHTVGVGRPAYLVFSKDRFDLVQANEVYTTIGEGKSLGFDTQSPWLQPLTGPAIVGGQLPKDIVLFNKLGLTALSGGPDVQNLTVLHVPYAAVLKDIQTSAQKLNAYQPKTAGKQAQLSTLQAKYPADALITPVKVKFEILTAVLAPSDGRVLGVENVDVFD